jgi:hypothetical protein
MTLPDERYRAVKYARQFLYELCDPKKTPGVPKIIRQQAHSILRHYPGDWDMQRAADSAPEVFQTQMEPVSRLMAQYQQSKTQRTLTLDKSDKTEPGS